MMLHKKTYIITIMVLTFTKQLTIANEVVSGTFSMEQIIEKLGNNSTEPKMHFQTTTEEAMFSDYISRSIFDFGHDIASNLVKLKRNSKCEVFSPISIVSSLNLLLLGAKGTSFDELMTALKYNKYSSLFEHSSKIHEWFSLLTENFSKESKQFTSGNISWKDDLFNTEVSDVYRTNDYKNESGTFKISIVNGLFVQQGFSLRNNYVMVAKNLYKCEINNLDFANYPFRAAQYINDWIKNETKGLIPNIIGDTLASETKVVIANSLYLKAEWLNEFIDGATQNKNFYPNGLQNQAITVEMMANAGRFPYFESTDLDCRIMGFPYKQNQTTMYILIPNNSNKSKLRKLQADLTFDKLETMINQMIVKTAVILLPKMSLTNQYNLKDILEGLGVTSIFSPRVSDLSLITQPSGNPMEHSQMPWSMQMGQTEGLHNQLIFSRLHDELISNVSNKKKRDITYKVQNDNSRSPLEFNNFLLNKRITKVNLAKKRHSERYRRNANDALLRDLEILRQTNLPNPGLYANDVLHKINLIINEQGTEAGAATAVTINRSGPQVTFRVEVPFLIIIRHDSTKLPLFYGSVFEPFT